MKIEGEATAGKMDNRAKDQSHTAVDVNETSMRKMRGLFATGVTAVTTAHNGKLRGITVSAFSVVSLDPPLVLVCIAKEAATHAMIVESAVFVINILSDDQEFLSERFAARAPVVDERFDGVPYRTAATGAPILEKSIAWYDCRVQAMHDGGDHTIFVGHVEAIGFGESSRRPLVYYANRYVHLQD